MISPSESLLFPTQKLYSLPSGDDYKRTKNVYLLERDAQYANKNVQDKWDFLIRQFSACLPEFSEENKPNGLSTAQIRERLEAFRLKRKSTSLSLYNLSLEQANRYFEDFLFLYTTEDPRFKLTPAAKKTMLCSVIRATGVCETGLNTEFYSALQEVQRDTDWMRSELSKARAECIRSLHKLYNAQNNISNSMNVHVYDHFVTMANRQNLGIEQKETILDIYSNLVSRDRLNACFNNHYKPVFTEYEHHAELTLSTYINNEISAVLGSNRWKTPLY